MIVFRILSRWCRRSRVFLKFLLKEKIQRGDDSNAILSAKAWSWNKIIFHTDMATLESDLKPYMKRMRNSAKAEFFDFQGFNSLAPFVGRCIMQSLIKLKWILSNLLCALLIDHTGTFCVWWKKVRFSLRNSCEDYENVLWPTLEIFSSLVEDLLIHISTRRW